MKNNKRKIIVSFGLIAISVIALMILLTPPKPAKAQLAGALGCKVNINFSQAVPVWDQNTQAMKNVTCVGNGIAWQLARIALHALTQSVVNWINTGFEGSPAFLSDPQGFFLDTADQITGAFIANNGPLQALCSPFGLDIRLSLALGQMDTTPRYTCTLSEIIRQQKNGGGVNVTVDQRQGGATIGDFQNGNILNDSSMASINGASIEGYLAGDFDQGGWPAFWSLFSEPDSNPYGASLKAQSDLQMQILAKQNAVNKDLDRGAGFLSWQKCETIETGAGPQKECRTETPGSVISASLNKQLGAPTDELNLTSEINQVVSALFSQLVTKVLSSGLLSSSQVDVKSGRTQSVVDELTNDPNLQANFSNLKQQAMSNLDDAEAPTLAAAEDRNLALSNILAVQSEYTATRACLVSRLSQANQGRTSGTTFYQSQISALDLAMAANVTPKVTKYQTAADGAANALVLLDRMKASLESAETTQDLSVVSNEAADKLNARTGSAADPDAAKADLTKSIAEAKELQKALKPYQNACNNGYLNM